MPSISDLKEKCGSPKKADPWREKVARGISIRITWFLLALFPGITPNQVTIFMIVVGMVSAISFVFGGYWGALIGALLLQFHLILDACDGEIARYKKLFSTRGLYLDYIGHFLVSPLIILGMGVGAFLHNFSTFNLPIPKAWFLAAGISGMYFLMMNNLLKLKKMEMWLDKEDWKMLKKMKIKQGYSPKNPIINEMWYLFRIDTFNAIFFSAIFGLIPYLVLAYGIILPLQTFKRFFSETKSLSSFREG